MKKSILFILFFLIACNSVIANISNELKSAREVYYKAIEKEKFLESALVAFEKIANKSKKNRGMATTYIGSLVMLKGKYAFWPQTKLRYVNEGIEIMDKGLAEDPKNIESLFIYGSTCYYLPFFLGKSSLAEEKFKEIIKLMPSINKKDYESEILKNAMQFILDNIKISASEKRSVEVFMATIDQ